MPAFYECQDVTGDMKFQHCIISIWSDGFYFFALRCTLHSNEHFYGVVYVGGSCSIQVREGSDYGQGKGCTSS